MIKYCKKILFFKIHEVWFTYQFNFWDLFSLNSFYHVKNNHKWIPAVPVNSYTLELDLTQSIDQIFFNFSKQIRQQIKIAEKENTVCYFENDIKKFVDFFNHFAVKKQTWTTNQQRIEAMGENVKISFAENNGRVLAAHSYIIDQHLGIVRHFHSATKRLEDEMDKNLIGRANKYLTVCDIQYFKQQGFKIFDFGGFAKDTQNESLKGINNYKLLFGGKLVTCNNYYSINYWVLKKMTQTIHRLKKESPQV